MDQRAVRVTIIMGVMGCGKSTYGTALAARSGARFIEGDDLHGAANLAKMAAGIALADADRWPWLDRIAAAINESIGDGADVVATCSALRRVYRDRLRAAITAPVRFVMLDVPRAELWRRVGSRTGHFMPQALLDSQLATLEWPGGEEGVAIVRPA
ncbi:MAG: gluconokinase [Sphingobium sp.]|nr:gluconokinase [Sphingobium sp.]